MDFYISIVYSIILKRTHEYFCEVLRIYSSTYSSTFQVSGLIRVLILSTRFMPGSHSCQAGTAETEELWKLENMFMKHYAQLIWLPLKRTYTRTTWPDRLNKSGSTLSQSEEQILIDIMNDHGLEYSPLEKRTH